MVFIGIAIGGPLHGIIAKLFTQMRSWILWTYWLTILSFTCIMLSALLNFYPYWMCLLYFSTGFFVSSMLLCFAQIRHYYPEIVHGTLFALMNMVIGLCGFLFQFLLGKVIGLARLYFSLFTQIQTFEVGFIVLLIFLLLGGLIIYRSELS